MAFLLTFLGSRAGLWVISSALVVAFVAGLHHKIKQSGWDEREAIAVKEDKDRQEEQGKADARYMDRQRAYIAALDIQIAAAAEKQRALEKKARELQAQLQGSVTTYVPPDTDKRIRDCGGIPVGFVRHYDASVAGPSAGPLPPAPEGGVVDRDSGIALSVVASTSAFNHGQFHRCITALKGWEEWYPGVKAIYESSGQGTLAPP